MRKCSKMVQKLYELAYILTALFFYAVLKQWFNREVFETDIESDPYADRNLRSASIAEKLLAKLPPYPVIVWGRENNVIEHPPMVLQCGDFACNVITSFIQLKNSGAYLFYGPLIKYDLLPLPRRPNIIWGVYEDESPLYVADMMHEEVLKLFNYSSTFSRYSDVPFPLRHLESLESITSLNHYVNTSLKNAFLSDLSPVLYLSTQCEDATERDEYVAELMEFINIDSYGACLKNEQLPPKLELGYAENLLRPEFLGFVARYKFVIAIENYSCDDYITEKLWRSICVGTVPIYFGSSTVRDWLPNAKSAILIEDYPTPKVLSEHLIQLMSNDTLYEEYLEHKTKGVISNLRIQQELTRRPYQKDPEENIKRFECLLCRKLHIKPKRVRVMKKRHLNCRRPVSALTLKNIDSEYWKSWWDSSKSNAERISNLVNYSHSLS